VGGLASRGGGGGSYRSPGFPYWRVTNNTGEPILVRGSGNKSWVPIKNGKSKSVNRRKSYKLYVKYRGDERRRPYHAIMDGNPNIVVSAPYNQLTLSYGQSQRTPRGQQQGYPGPQGPPPGAYYPGAYPPTYDY